MWKSMPLKYRNIIERNIDYPDERVEKIRIEKNSTCTNDVRYIYNGFFVVYLVSSVDYRNEMLKTFDLMCCKEFEEFINKHVYNDDLQDELKRAKGIYDTITGCNF